MLIEMQNILKDKKILIGGGIAFLIIILAGGYFVLFNNKSADNPQPDEEQEVILTMSAEEIGLTLEMGEDGKEVIMNVENVEGITMIDYELSYTSEGDIPRGAIGSVEVTGEPIEKKITLGTCSDVCHYDEGVSDIKIILKVTKADGKVYQVEKSLEE